MTSQNCELCSKKLRKGSLGYAATGSPTEGMHKSCRDKKLKSEYLRDCEMCKLAIYAIEFASVPAGNTIEAKTAVNKDYHKRCWNKKPVSQSELDELYKANKELHLEEMRASI